MPFKNSLDYARAFDAGISFPNLARFSRAGPCLKFPDVRTIDETFQIGQDLTF